MRIEPESPVSRGESVAVCAEGCQESTPLAALRGMGEGRYLLVVGHVPQSYTPREGAVDQEPAVPAEAGGDHFIGANQRLWHRFVQIEQDEPVIPMGARQQSSIGADRQSVGMLVGLRKKDLLRLGDRRVPHEGKELAFASVSLSNPLAIVAHLDWSLGLPRRDVRAAP